MTWNRRCGEPSAPRDDGQGIRAGSDARRFIGRVTETNHRARRGEMDALANAHTRPKDLEHPSGQDPLIQRRQARSLFRRKSGGGN